MRAHLTRMHFHGGDRCDNPAPRHGHGLASRRARGQRTSPQPRPMRGEPQCAGAVTVRLPGGWPGASPFMVARAAAAAQPPGAAEGPGRRPVVRPPARAGRQAPGSCRMCGRAPGSTASPRPEGGLVPSLAMGIAPPAMIALAPATSCLPGTTGWAGHLPVIGIVAVALCGLAGWVVAVTVAYC